MNKKSIITQTAERMKTHLDGEASGHDWWHVYRVWQNALHIGAQEHADLFVVELAALLHDIADWKFHDGNEDIGPNMAAQWLEELSVEPKTIAHICDIIRNLSFKGAGVATPMDTLEGMIVQDADRLDAIGAIGIARAFAYGGTKNRLMHDPTIPPQHHTSSGQYKNNAGPTINHFYEKLLLLQDRMNTKTARKIAHHRHRFMENFLEEFLQEWDGKR